MKNFALRDQDIIAGLNRLASDDKHVAAAIDLVGYPSERVNDEGFNTVMRVIVGQQLSVKAAATIWGRVEALAGEEAATGDYAQISDEALRGAGLSRQKISYVRSLCERVDDGTLDFEQLKGMSDADAVKAITAVKGLGVWSAHMYLMFSLGRADIMPVGDLAVRVGIGRIIGHAERPNEKECHTIGQRWAPYRSMMALMAWHYYSNAPF